MSYEYDLDCITKSIDNNTRIIYFINPHWQIGKLLNDKRIKSCVQAAEDKSIPIVVDETYAEFTFPKRKFFKFGEFNKYTPVISINSSSRLFGMSGNRIAWIVLYGDSDCFEDL